MHEIIKKTALQLGFDACGIAKAEKFKTEAEYWQNYIQKGFHADMEYLERNIEKRLDIRLLFPPAESVIVVLKNYYTNESLQQSDYIIAKYAFGKDYHAIMKLKLRQLQNHLSILAPDSESRCFVDTAPVLEKAWAQRAGLGWIGKNSCLINKKFGSFTFIGILVTSLILKADKPHENYCGNCTKCLEACPTKALQQPWQLNANLCKSYITIERKSLLIPEDAPSIGNNIFGCDACQNVCPWNQNLTVHNDNNLKILDLIKNFTNEDWNNLTKNKFTSYFGDSPLQRAGFEKLCQNIKQTETYKARF